VQQSYRGQADFGQQWTAAFSNCVVLFWVLLLRRGRGIPALVTASRAVALEVTEGDRSQSITILARIEIERNSQNQCECQARAQQCGATSRTYNLWFSLEQAQLTWGAKKRIDAHTAPYVLPVTGSFSLARAGNCRAASRYAAQRSGRFARQFLMPGDDVDPRSAHRSRNCCAPAQPKGPPSAVAHEVRGLLVEPCCNPWGMSPSRLIKLAPCEQKVICSLRRRHGLGEGGKHYRDQRPADAALAKRYEEFGFQGLF